MPGDGWRTSAAPAVADRFAPDELARERADARDVADRRTAEIRRLGGDPDDPRLEPPVS